MKRKSKGIRKHIREAKARERREIAEGERLLHNMPPLQKEVLQAIIVNVEQTGRMPSLRELGIALRRHHTLMQVEVKALIKKGLLIIDKDTEKLRLNPERYEVKVLRKSE